MAILSKPLHRPALCSLPLEGGHAQPLLGREITLYFGGPDKKANRMVTTVGEIYRTCRKTLSAEFGSTGLFIKGSCVSHLFSKEPFGDIDIHATIDVTKLPEHQRVGKGYAFKWAVLKGIYEIITEKFPPSPGGSRSSIPSAEILFEEETNLLCAKGAPFNVHTIRFPGEIPVEFTMFNIVQEVRESVRNYDFNSGSLQLCIEDGGAITIHSNTPDMRATIDEVSRRELTCVAPEEIERKGLCRYLAKVVLSGYYDKDKELLAAMLEGVKERDQGKTEDKILAAEIVKEIIAHFKEKAVTPLGALLSLWLLPKPKPCSEILGALLEEAKEKLRSALLTDPLPERQALSSLVQKGKKAECCWYLMMQAKSARKVLHRGEESLQLEIPSYPMFASDLSEQCVFIIVPISGFSKFSESGIPGAFLDLQEKDMPKFQVEDPETKALFQSLCSEVLTKASLYPVLLTAIDRFGIEPQGNFSKLFIEWVRFNDSQPELEKLKIPFETLKKLQPTLLKTLEDPALFKELEEMLAGATPQPAPVLSMLKMLHGLVEKKELCSFDSIGLESIIARYASIFFLKREKLGALSAGDEQILLDFAKAHAEENCKLDRLRGYIRRGGDLLCKRTLSILFVLFIRKEVPLSEGVVGARICFELGYRSEGLKFLQELLSRSDSLESPEIQSLFEELTESQPLEFAIFLKENAAVITQKTGSFSSIIIPFLEKLKAKELTPSLIGKFNEVLGALCDAEEKDKIIKSLFVSAAKGHPQSRILLDEIQECFKISILDAYLISEMNNDELRYLSQLSRFDAKLAGDSEFAMGVIMRAAQLQNRELVMKASLLLARTDPDRCLHSLDILNSMRKDPADLTTLLPTLDILLQLLEINPGLILTNSMCRPLIQARLVDLSMYFETDQATGSIILQGELFTTLREFHKKVALYTIEDPCWKKIWDIVCDSGGNQAIKDWINPADIPMILSGINPKGSILNLIDVFALDGPFTYQLIRQISTLPEEAHLAFAPVVQLLLKNSSDVILRDAPPRPPVEAQAVISFIAKIHRFFETPEHDVLQMISMNMDICCFIAAYGQNGNELKLLGYFDGLYKTGGEGKKKFLQETTLPHKCLFLFAKRAMARRDFSILSKISISYKAWAGNIAPNKYLNSEDIHSQCIQWMEFLGGKEGVFSDCAVNKTFSTRSSEFHALWLYFKFLADTIKGCPFSKESVLSLADAKINQVNFSHLLAFIDFLSKKKLIRAAVFITELPAIAGKLDSQQFEVLTSRCIYMATNMLLGMQKQPIQQEDLNPVLDLVTLINALIESSEAFEKMELPPAAIRKFLEAAWMVFPHFIGKEGSLRDCMRAFSSMEGTLSLKELRAHHMSWLESILARKGIVHPAEIGGWIMLTLRITPKASETVSKWFYPEKFVDKHFISQDYFDNPITTRAFFEILDLGIERLPDYTASSPVVDPMSDLDVSRIIGLDIFNVLSFYSGFFQQTISDMKGKRVTKSEGIRLEKFYISLLIKDLERPKSDCKSLLLTYLFPRISDNRNGRVVFMRDSELSVPEQVKIFYLLVRNQPLVKKGQFNLAKEIVKELYENEKAVIQRILSPEQIREIEPLIYKGPHSSKAAGSGAGGGKSWW
jgi:hypothetical protein